MTQQEALERAFGANSVTGPIGTGGAREKASAVNTALSKINTRIPGAINVSDKKFVLLGATESQNVKVTSIEVLDGNTIKVNNDRVVQLNFTKRPSENAASFVQELLAGTDEAYIAISGPTTTLPNSTIKGQAGDIQVKVADKTFLSAAEASLSAGLVKFNASNPLNTSFITKSPGGPFLAMGDAAATTNRSFDHAKDMQYHFNNPSNQVNDDPSQQEMFKTKAQEVVNRIEGANRDKFTFNRKDYTANQFEKVSDHYVIKIGDTILNIPPTHITLTELRSSSSLDIIGFDAMNIPSYNTRMAIKMNLVFTGRDIDDSLKRIITQFTYCPFNIVHSTDLYRLCVAENSWLRSSIITTDSIPYITVTMDEYTVYTIEGHPDSLGCSLQLSLFNYAAYMDGDPTERMAYFKMEFDKDGNGVMPKSGHLNQTSHLEQSVHAYNFQIEQILKNQDNKFFYGHTLGLNNYERGQLDVDKNNSTATLFKLNSFFDLENKVMEVKEDVATAELLCSSMAVTYQNNFGWFPVVGYSSGVPQYIGPGQTCITLNSKVSLDAIYGDENAISKLFKTYNDNIEKHVMNYYDDRFIIDSSVTRLTDSLVASISDIAITSLPNHPGFMDVNIILRKSPYLSNLLDNNMMAEQDEYWGFNRVVRLVNQTPKLDEAVQEQLKEEKNALMVEYGWCGTWAENSGDIKSVQGLSQKLVHSLNLAASKVLNDKSVTQADRDVINTMKLFSPTSANAKIKLVSFLKGTTLGGEPLETIINFRYFSRGALPLNTTDEIYALCTQDQAGFFEPGKFRYSLNKAIGNTSVDELTRKKNAVEARAFVYTLILTNKDIFQPETQGADKTLLETIISSMGTSNGINDEMAAKFLTSSDGKKLYNKLFSKLYPDFNFNKRTLKEILDSTAFNENSTVLSAPLGVLVSDASRKETLRKLNIAAGESVVAGETLDLDTSDPESVFAKMETKADRGTKAQQVEITYKKRQKNQKKISVELQDIKNAPKPFAAHRYWPLVDNLISPMDVVLSGTVGGWFYTKIKNDAGHLNNIISNLNNTIDNTVSWAFDTEAWKNVFPAGSKSEELYGQYKAGNTPFALIDAIKYPQSRKEIDYQTKVFNVGNGNSTIASPLFSMMSEALMTFDKNNTGRNAPFSGLSDWAYISTINGTNMYGSSDITLMRTQINNKKVASYDGLSTTADATKLNAQPIDYDMMHNQWHNNLGTINNNGMLDFKSATTPAQISGGAFETSILKRTDQDKELQYTHVFNYLTNVSSIQKNASSIQPLLAYAGTSSGANPEITDNTSGESQIEVQKTEVEAFIRVGIDELFADENTKYKTQLVGYITAYISAAIKNSQVKNLERMPDATEIKEIIQSAFLLFTGTKRLLSVNAKRISTPRTFAHKIFYVPSMVDMVSNGLPLDGLVANAVSEAMLLSLCTTELAKIVTEKSETPGPDGKTQFTYSKFTTNEDIIGYFGQNRGVTATNTELHVGSIAGVKIYGTSATPKEESLLTMIFPTITTSTTLGEKINLKSAIRASMVTSTLQIPNENIKVEDVAKALFESISLVQNNSGFTQEILGSPFATGTASDNTKSFLINQITQSMLPTVGIQNAFPTYKLYIIDSGLSDIKFHSLDNWYDFRLVQDMMVVKSKQNPAHNLRCRVVVDERFITTNMSVPQRDNDRRWIEGRNPSAPTSLINTDYDHTFYMGKVPLRAGMRVCLKLGYHSDPRQLDTVFIGTITELGEGGQKGVYDLIAEGDGRELSMPATMSNTSLSGWNYGDLIAKLLRGNPALVNFGRNYGSTIERYSREHLVMYGLAQCAANGILEDKMAKALITGTGIAVGAGMIAMPGLSSTLGVAAGAVGIGISSAVTLASIAGEANKKYLPEATGKGIGTWATQRFTGFNPNGRLFNVRDYLSGNTFDMDKAAGQIYKHFADTYKSGHDPIDDNIWAVDIWQNLANITLSNKEEIPVSSNQTTWDVLQDIKRLYPNYALDVRPYGSRSTIYLGPLNWMMWRTDDPVVAMLPQITETSNEKILQQHGKHFNDLYKTNAFGHKTNKPANSYAPLVEFQKTHLATSDSNIILNGIQSTPQRGWNSVVVNDAKGGQTQITANSEIHPNAIRVKQVSLPWTSNEAKVLQYTLGTLKEGVEKMYGGSLTLRGNPKIEPYDKIYVADKINKMYGWIEVETVIHKFDSNYGFTTHIVPNMVCSVNSDAYKTTSQLVKSMMSKSLTMEMFGNFAAGVTMAAAFTAGMPLLGLTGGGYAILATVLNLYGMISLAQTGYSTYQTVTDIVNTDVARIDEDSVLEVFEASHRASLKVSAMTTGTYFGSIMGYILRLAKNDNRLSDAKKLSNSTWRTIRNAWYKYTDPITPSSFNAGNRGGLIAQRHLTNVISDINKLNEKLGMNKVDSLESTSSAEQIKEKSAKLREVVAEYEAKITEKSTTLTEKEIKKIQAKNKSIIETLEKLDKHMETNPNLKGAVDKILARADRRGVSSFSSKQSAAAKSVVKGTMGLFMFQSVLTAISLIPTYVETFMINNMTRGNSITINPLWHKNSLMLAGLDGWQQSNIFIHAKNYIANARRAWTETQRAALYSTPTLANNPILKDATLKKIEDYKASRDSRSAKVRNSASEAEVIYKVNGFRKIVEKYVEKYLPKVNARAKTCLTVDRVLAIIHRESEGVVGVNWEGGVGLMQIIPTYHYDRMLSCLTKEEANQWRITYKNHATRNNSGQVKSITKILREAVADRITTKPDSADLNINMGVGYYVDCLNLEVKYGEAGLFERALKAYNGGPSWRDLAQTTISYKATATREAWAENKGKTMDKYVDAITNKVSSYTAPPEVAPITVQEKEDSKKLVAESFSKAGFNLNDNSNNAAEVIAALKQTSKNEKLTTLSKVIRYEPLTNNKQIISASTIGNALVITRGKLTSILQIQSRNDITPQTPILGIGDPKKPIYIKCIENNWTQTDASGNVNKNQEIKISAYVRAV